MINPRQKKKKKEGSQVPDFHREPQHVRIWGGIKSTQLFKHGRGEIRENRWKKRGGMGTIRAEGWGDEKKALEKGPDFPSNLALGTLAGGAAMTKTSGEPRKHRDGWPKK